MAIFQLLAKKYAIEEVEINPISLYIRFTIFECRYFL